MRSEPVGSGSVGVADGASASAALRAATDRVVMASLSEAGEPTRLRRGFDAILKGSSATTAFQRRSLVSMSRFLDENEPVYGGYVDTWVDQVLGPDGLSPMPMPGSEASKAAVRLFMDWALDPRAVDLGERMDFFEAQRWAVRANVRDGESLTVLDRSGALSFVECDRLASNRQQDDQRKGEVIDSILVGEHGQALGYYVHPYDRFGNVRIGESHEAFIGADDAIHVGFFRRANQVRGRVPGSRIIEDCVQLAEYRQAVQLAAKLAAVLALIIKTESPGGVPIAMRTGTQDTSGSGGSGSQTRQDNLLKLEAGSIFSMKAGEDVTQVRGEQPSTTFDGFLDASMRIIAAGGLMPKQILLRDMSRANFSSARMEQYVADLAARPRRGPFCRRWCRRIFEWKVGGWIMAGLLPAREDALRCVWSEPSRISADPEKQVRADRAEIEAGLAAPQAKIRERGGDINEVYDQLEEAKKMQAQRGLVFVNTPGAKAAGEGSRDGETGGGERRRDEVGEEEEIRE